MSFIDEYGEFVVKQYQKGKSVKQIAEELNTYTNKVRRTLIKLGQKLRGKSEAQALALKSGRSTPPMEGKTHSEETKNRLSDMAHQHWEKMTDEQRKARRKMAKEYWESLTEEEREELNKKGNQAIRQSSREGSKLEKFLFEELTKAGHEVIMHKKALVSNTKLELDLLIPEMMVVVEVDGPSHFFPIWGEENLKKNIRADHDKSSLLLQEGYCVIRIKDMSSSATRRKFRLAKEGLMKALNKISEKFPEPGHRMIEVEVK